MDVERSNDLVISEVLIELEGMHRRTEASIEQLNQQEA
jgi:hypothetical protein